MGSKVVSGKCVFRHYGRNRTWIGSRPNGQEQGLFHHDFGYLVQRDVYCQHAGEFPKGGILR